MKIRKKPSRPHDREQRRPDKHGAFSHTNGSGQAHACLLYSTHAGLDASTALARLKASSGEGKALCSV